MAVTVPIWPGSSSFSSGSTPYGFYDTDIDFQTEADQFSVWAARRLGYPIMDVEMQAVNFYACLEEAINEYGSILNSYNIRDNLLNLYGSVTSSNLTGRTVSPTLSGLIEIAKEYGVEAGSGGNVTYYTGSVVITAGQQVYDLTDSGSTLFETGTPGVDAIAIKRIYHEAPPALARFFDPFIGSGIGTQQMLDSFGFGNYSPGVSFLMQPIFADLLRLQAIEFNDQVRRSAYSFDLKNNRLKLFPIPNGVQFEKVYFDYILVADRANPLKGTTGTVSDFSNVPYNNIVYGDLNDVGRQWVRRYALALAKELLGLIRGKYQNVPIPNAETTLNYSDLLSQAEAEKTALLEELRELLDSMSRQAQLERKQAESDSLLEQFKKIPMKIYVG